MGSEVVFEIPIHLNPTATTSKTNTLVFTETGFYVKEVPELAADYVNIVSVQKRRWWLLNSLIHIRFNSSIGERTFNFTAARGAIADEAGNKKVHKFLMDAIGKRSVGAKTIDPSLKKLADTSRSGWWSGKMETREDALKVINETSNAFIGVAVIMALIGFFLDIFIIVDAILFGALGVVLKYTKSRISAILLFLISTLAFFTTIFNMLTHAQGGRNVLLSVIILWSSIRAVQATKKLHTIDKNKLGFRG